MSDLRCNPLSSFNALNLWTQNQSQVCETPNMTEVPEEICESPPAEKPEQKPTEGPAKGQTISLLSPPSPEETLHVVNQGKLDLNFVETFQGMQSESFADCFEMPEESRGCGAVYQSEEKGPNYHRKFQVLGYQASDTGENSFRVLDSQESTPGLQLRTRVGELQFKGNINPFSEKPGFEASAKTYHFSATEGNSDGSSNSVDFKILEAHAGVGMVTHEDGSRTTKIGVGASVISGEMGYDDGEGNSGKFGISLGLGAGITITEKDSDRDGIPESCFGAEIGPISFEFCSEVEPSSIENPRHIGGIFKGSL